MSDFDEVEEKLEPEDEGPFPKITIDKDALRFEFKDGGENIFWDRFFIGNDHIPYQARIMRLIHRAYVECIQNAGHQNEVERRSDD